MKRTLSIYLVVSVSLILGVFAIRIVQAQFSSPTNDEIANLSNVLRVSYWTSVLSDSGQEEFHAQALEQIVLPARLVNNIGVLEDMAQVGLQSNNEKIIVQAYMTLGDALFEQGKLEEAKNAYLKAAMSGSPKAARYYAQRLWDMGEKVKSVHQSLTVVRDFGLQIEDCVGEDCLLRRIDLIGDSHDQLNLDFDLASWIIDFVVKGKTQSQIQSKLIQNLDEIQLFKPPYA